MYHKNTFPDQDLLKKLVDHQLNTIKKDLTLEAQLAMCSGALLNWKFDMLSDANMAWSPLQELQIDDLTLTGVNPDWNQYTIEKAERNPAKFRELIEESPEVKDVMAAAKFEDIPILVREHEGKLMLFDGMKRTVGALFLGKKTIKGYVGRFVADPKPQCELHTIYDILRSYNRGINKDAEGLKAALQYLLKSYSNVEDALRTRFSAEWENNPELQKIIKEVLGDA